MAKKSEDLKDIINTTDLIIQSEIEKLGYTAKKIIADNYGVELIV